MSHMMKNLMKDLVLAFACYQMSTDVDFNAYEMTLNGVNALDND